LHSSQAATLPASSLLFVLPCYRPLPALHSFPTRRSSDLSFAGSRYALAPAAGQRARREHGIQGLRLRNGRHRRASRRSAPRAGRSEEHTSELQSPYDLVCRLLLEKKKQKQNKEKKNIRQK